MKDYEMGNLTMAPSWDPAWVPALQQNLVYAASSCLGYGCFMILAIISLRILVCSGLASGGTRILLAAVCTFILSSTLLCIGHLAISLHQIVIGPYETDGNDWRSFLVLVCARLNYLLNDALVMWRAWVLANRKTFQITLAVFALLTLACTVVEAICVVQPAYFKDEMSHAVVNLLLFIPLLSNNLLATMMIFYTTWIYRTGIKIHLDKSTQQVRIECVLFLLIESGYVYCGWWILCFISDFAKSTPMMMGEVLRALSPFMAAIYPVLIILILQYQKSNEQETSSNVCGTQLAFASRPPATDQTQSTFGPSIVQSIADIQSSQSVQHQRHSLPVPDELFLKRSEESHGKPA